ncbi:MULTISPECIES: type VI secretion system ImpA family N-terminal domain-containing protein [Vibrio]|uniref:Type VI secretion system ImpA family N-terminal domain-containing protein n=1 Tax=Vibrio qingdaonensis TaxID=2829491 RepID=A0A9X3CUE2_9VIBR|nr:type VI secretion system ImpA family N-terminal domain-containing protein [Vibrio qingdaonensis]MCW8348645.1 type VI secretion system ImpA family N-terminal domain-containing protein [Vibrio qingdaonensis]
MIFTDFARRPIDETLPSGINPNNLEEFNEIKQQINNLNKVTGRTSWKLVQTLSKKILVSHSKDFRCSCYYTVAANQNEGLKGLVEGLSSLLDLCVVYWFSAFPEHSKSNARISAIEWMVENIEKRIQKKNVTQDDLPLIEASHQLCIRIEEELRLHYGIKAPSLGRIHRILKRWIEDLKERKIRDIAILEQSKKKPVHSVPVISPPVGVSIDIPSSASKQPQEEAKLNPSKHASGRLAIYSMIGIIVIALVSHFAHKQHTYLSLENQIAHASITELKPVLDSLGYDNHIYSSDLRSAVVKRLDLLLTDWASDPIKVSEVNTISALTEQLIVLYPDSSSARLLHESFTRQRIKFESDFQTLLNRFTSARTTFANVKINNSDSDSAKAYEYSNSLFPLLGRIEYAEKNAKQDELDRSILILNTYLYKLNQLQASIGVQKNN